MLQTEIAERVAVAARPVAARVEPGEPSTPLRPPSHSLEPLPTKPFIPAALLFAWQEHAAIARAAPHAASCWRWHRIRRGARCCGRRCMRCTHVPRPLPPLHVRNHPRRECGRRPSSHNRASARQGQRRACAAVQAPRLIVIVKLYKSLLIDYARNFDRTPGLLVWLTTMPCVQRKRLRATRSHRRPNASPALAAAAVRRARRRAAAAALLSVAPVQLALGHARSVRAARSAALHGISV